MRVLARAYGDQPLDRVVADRSGRTVFVATESALSANSSAGVGFPINCIYEFDESLFRDLEGAWRAGDSQRLSDLWRQAHLGMLPPE